MAVVILLGVLILNDMIPLATFMGTGTICAGVYNGLNQVSKLAVSFSASKPYFDKITIHAGEAQLPDFGLPTLQEGITVKDVSFGYDEKKPILVHMNAEFKKGGKYALTGPSGCGKSTLLNLIPRFYDVTGGSVTVDGIDVRQMPQAQLHDLLGYVPQKGVLFSGTIDSNLKFGGDHITDAAVKKAAAIAQATEFIDAKPEGYASPIAQGGSNVSGGQKQRLSIARAIAKDPKIYLFDDSFSALDYKTDVALRRALKAQTDNATVIIVAQRISTVLHANQILVLDEGRLVGKGTHAQLMASCPEYQEIARSQLSQKELDLEPLNTEKEGV